MRTGALVLLLATAAAAQPGGIEGTVTDRATGQPVPGVHVRLFEGSYVRSGMQTYGALTDPTGHFSVAALPQGDYSVVLERYGYVQQAESVVLIRAKESHSQAFTLSPLIATSGRVFNSEGEPMGGSMVQASQQPLSATSQRMTTSGPYRETDSQGRFRIFVTPRKYYVMAGPPAGTLSDVSSKVVYGNTVYPTVVEVKAGAETGGVEIQLALAAPQRFVTATGTVTGIPAGGRVTLAYTWSEPGADWSVGGGANVEADGRFTVEHLRPGILQLVAKCSAGGNEFQSTVLQVELKDADAGNLRLDLHPGGAVTGTLEVQGAPLPGTVAVDLVPEKPGGLAGGAITAAVAADGAFRLTGVLPGRYHVQVPLPENAFLKSVSLNGSTSRDDRVDLSSGVNGPTLKVVVSRNGASLSGEVRDLDGGPLLSSAIMVSLEPEPGQMGPLRGGVRVVNGHYELTGLPPGKYRLKVGNGPPSEPIEVAEGARVIHDLKRGEVAGAKQ